MAARRTHRLTTEPSPYDVARWLAERKSAIREAVITFALETGHFYSGPEMVRRANVTCRPVFEALEDLANNARANASARECSHRRLAIPRGALGSRGTHWKD